MSSVPKKADKLNLPLSLSLSLCHLEQIHSLSREGWIPVASFTKEVNPRLAKRPLVLKGRLANRGLTSLVKEATRSHLKTLFTGIEFPMP